VCLALLRCLHLLLHAYCSVLPRLSLLWHRPAAAVCVCRCKQVHAMQQVSVKSRNVTILAMTSLVACDVRQRLASTRLVPTAPCALIQSLIQTVASFVSNYLTNCMCSTGSNLLKNVLQCVKLKLIVYQKLQMNIIRVKAGLYCLKSTSLVKSYLSWPEVFVVHMPATAISALSICKQSILQVWQ
jgi:hypothetical protein